MIIREEFCGFREEDYLRDTSVEEGIMEEEVVINGKYIADVSER